jgi:DNA repair protein RecO (recombination protein O)
MLIEQQPAYVLHARPYRETSLLLECLTRDHGRLGVVARGVRRERARVQRAQLEPFQPLTLDLSLRGELATLRGAEPAGPPLRLPADAGMAGLYLNELVVRLTGRQDPQPDLFEAYARTLPRLLGPGPLGWQLRRFERDLLAAIGYALQLDFEADSGAPLTPEGWYRYQVEYGPVAYAQAAPRAISGAALLALREDRCPAGSSDLAALRGLMRELIRFHLGGAELHAWRVLSGAIGRR